MSEMCEWKQQLVAELADLNRRRGEIAEFIYYNKDFDDLPEGAQGRLRKQLKAMNEYASILVERVRND